MTNIENENNQIKEKAINSIKWTGINSIYNALSGPIYILILVKLLSPKDFAYIAVIALLISISELLISSGLGQAIIQKDTISLKEISSVFWLNLIIISLLAISLYFSANSIEAFYKLDNLRFLIKLTSITILFNGLASIFRSLVQREFLFKRYSKLEIIRKTIDMITSVLFIFLGFGVTGYVFGTIISSFIFCLGLIVTSIQKKIFKLKIHFDLKDISKMVKFANLVSLKQITAFISGNIDEVIIGRFLGANTLGIYYFAKNLLFKPKTTISSSFRQVLFSLFSKLKHNEIELRNAYNKITKYIAFVAVPIFAGVLITANLFVPVLFGAKWFESINAIKAFSIACIPLILTEGIAVSVFFSINKVKLSLYIDLIINVIYFALLLIFISNGIYAVLLLLIIQAISKHIIVQYFISKNLKYSLLKYFSNIKKIFLCVILMLIIVILIQIITVNLLNQYKLILSVVGGVVSYFILINLIEKSFLKSLLYY